MDVSESRKLAEGLIMWEDEVLYHGERAGWTEEWLARLSVADRPDHLQSGAKPRSDALRADCSEEELVEVRQLAGYRTATG